MDRLTERTGEGQAIPRMDLKKNGHQRCMERLAEYEDLEEQGKLLKLPVAVGDTVYTIYSDEESSFIEEPKVEEVSTHRIWVDSMYFDYDDFGKIVFLTREEAEAALKEMEGKEV